MRAVVQRVSRAAVRVGGKLTGCIGQGLVVLVGIGREDSGDDARYLADKVAHLRVFEDGEGKMNLSLLDTGGSALVVSQFTLYGDCRRGRRPSFAGAAAPDHALPLYRSFVDSLSALGVPVETGRFQAMMELELCNDGPVTLLLDSTRQF